MISDAELAELCDKSSRDPKIVNLYRDNDFLMAYAKHTDLRVQEDPHNAIGGLWEEYGILQREFLISQGLKPEHRFLDFGCGTGRLARKIVPYLDPGNYIGVDISPEAINYAKALAKQEGWATRYPLLEITDSNFRPFDFGWAFSVFIHLPIEELDRIVRMVDRCLSPGGKFLFSYVPTLLHTRTGLKQFKHPSAYYRDMATTLNFSFSEIDWSGRQRILQFSR